MSADQVRFGVATPAPSLQPSAPGFESFEDYERFCAHAEEVGADLICTGEAPTVFEDTFVYLAAAARVTKKVLLGHDTMVPKIRHPAVLASSLSTLQRLSEGRAYNGIGTGAIALVDLGLGPARLAEFERYSRAVTDLTAGEQVEWEGNTIQMRWNAGRVPLFLGAEGPKAFELVGRIGDGAIIGTALSPDVVRFALRHIHESAERAGRAGTSFQVWHQTRVHVCGSWEEALQVPAIEQYLTRYARHLFAYSQRNKAASTRENLLTQRGIVVDEDTAERFRLYNEEYSEADAVAGRYLAGGSHNVALLDKYELREWIGPQCWIAGSHEEVVARFRELRDAGARNFICVQLAPNRMETVEQLAAVFEDVRR